MNKNVYVKPNIKVKNIGTEPLLAGSETQIYDVRPHSDISNPSLCSDNHFAKPNSVWDNEEEDDGVE